MNSRLLPIAAALLVSACASNPANEGSRSAADPWEPVNRPIHAFNQGVDKVLLRPIAKGYEVIFPSVIRQGVTNFSRNLTTPMVGINNLLQGKGEAALNDTGRFLQNSTFGVLGIFDLATLGGMDRNTEDFGQTLAVWGVPAGPYIEVPFLGPHTLRGLFGRPLDVFADPLVHYDNSSVRDKLYVLRAIDVRQRLFAADALIEDSPDRYVTIRESYLQRRRFQIEDGEPPAQAEEFYEDLLEEEEEEEPRD